MRGAWCVKWLYSGVLVVCGQQKTNNCKDTQETCTALLLIRFTLIDQKAWDRISPSNVKLKRLHVTFLQIMDLCNSYISHETCSCKNISTWCSCDYVKARTSWILSPGDGSSGTLYADGCSSRPMEPHRGQQFHRGDFSNHQDILDIYLRHFLATKSLRFLNCFQQQNLVC